ncbi:MAG: PGA biosynthesis protein CapA [Parcubacteria group bacterium GW2011_GWF2_38_76]|nr:MAG: PGA biosynthesis protein CapA [Parcubacteria group bacterium GW2011_GWF2_38_76]HBM45983.1 hypothetical protein [Patescibacteria group bacterium]
MKSIYIIIVLAVSAVAGFFNLKLPENEKPQDIQKEVVVNETIPKPEIKVLPAQKSTKILIVGDISFDRYIRRVSNDKGGDFIFSCIDDLLKSSDFVVGNLEGPITDNASISMGTVMGTPANFVFTFPTTSAELLKKHNISLVNLGNNHIGNFGMEGVASTKEYLKTAKVGYFGGLGADEPVYRKDGISFISYNEFGGQSPKKVALKIVEEKKKGNIVIVYAHWGEEYVDSVPRLRSVATLFAENGADAVVGSHPHIVLPSEYIGKTLVYYSLGNFIFDQYWDPEVMKGVALFLDISDGKITHKEFPIILKKDGRTCPNY